MDNGNWIIGFVACAFLIFFVYRLGKNTGKAILFVRDLIKQVLAMNRQEKP
jgi:hypothetical protein